MASVEALGYCHARLRDGKPVNKARRVTYEPGPKANRVFKIFDSRLNLGRYSCTHLKEPRAAGHLRSFKLFL
jgi:hypothetical protein